MSDWKDIQDIFGLSDSETDHVLDIVNWVTATWLQEKFGYAKDTPQSFPIRDRFSDETFQILFETALLEAEFSLDWKGMFNVK